MESATPSAMPTRPPLLRSSAHTILVLVLRLLTQAASLALALRLFGPDLYGNLAAAGSLALVLGILPNLGAGLVLMRRLPLDPHAPGDIWRYAWPQHVILGLLLALAYLLFGPALTHATLLPHACWLLLGLTEILISPLTAQLGMSLQAIEQVARGQWLQVRTLILRLLAVLPCFALADSARLIGYTGLQCLAATLGLVFAWRTTRQQLALPWRPRCPQGAEWREGAAYMSLSLVSAAAMELDKIVAIRSAGPYAAGLYASASRLISAGVLPMIGMLLASQPRLFGHAQTKRGELIPLVRRLALACLAAGLLAATALRLGEPILLWMLGPRFQALQPMLGVIAWAIPALGMHLTAVQLLVALGSPTRRIGFDLAGASLLVGLMLHLGRQGPTGLAWALLINEIALMLAGWGLVLRDIRRLSRVSGRDRRSTNPYA